MVEGTQTHARSRCRRMIDAEPAGAPDKVTYVLLHSIPSQILEAGAFFEERGGMALEFGLRKRF